MAVKSSIELTEKTMIQVPLPIVGLVALVIVGIVLGIMYYMKRRKR